MTRLIIAGAGIAGLTLGHALLKYAPEVQFTILERASELRAAGAGIILAPNAIPLLDDFGLHDPLRDIGQFLPYNQLTDARGKPWQKLPGPKDQLLAFHRAELMNLLQDRLKPHLQFSRSVQSLSQRGNTVQVQTDVGQESCDLLVGADGLHSRVRQGCGGLKPQYSGYTSWRTVIQNAPPVSGASEMWGHGRRLGLVPLTKGRMYVYFTLNAPAAMQKKVTAKELQHLFSEFRGADHGVLDRLDDTTPLIHTDIHDLPRPDWGKGRVLLMGDAAHALTPNLGQGAGMGIEDAVVLARCLGEHLSIEKATAAFRQLRHTRVQKVMLASRVIGRVGQVQHPLLVQARDALMSKGPAQSVPEWLWTPVVRTTA